jgi:hypothetical protein
MQESGAEMREQESAIGPEDEEHKGEARSGEVAKS